MNIIARHSTVNGFSIAITREVEGYVAPVFVVSRISPDGSMFALGHDRTESEARKIANRFWVRDVKGDRMIGCGTLAA